MHNNNILQSFSPLSAWISHIKNLHSKPIDMGLSRVREVAIRLNISKPAPFIFTLTGTNGKGTTSRLLELILIEDGYNVGVYSSPHLMRYSERVRINNSELPESTHTASFAVIEAARSEISLTYFEFSTLSALWIFKQKRLDIIILEVGLGGRLDATNVVDPDVAIITNIALDHTHWLGSDRESIGREKAGIFRTGKPAVIGEIDIPSSIIQIAKEKATKLFCYNIDWSFIRKKDYWSFKDTNGELLKLPIPYIPQLNAATALAAVRISKLKISEQAIHKGIINATLPGRFQIIHRLPYVILDVAHNPHAVSYLSKRLKTLTSTGRIFAVFGMLQDKDISGTIACIRNTIDYWYCTSLEGPRGASANKLMEYLNENEGCIIQDVVQAWRTAMSTAQPEDIVLVFGSFQIVACIMKILG